MTALPLLAFWTCAGLVVYAYVGYAALIWTLSRLFGRPVRPPVGDDRELPAVSLVLAAYNEEAVIEARLRNALAIDYPAGKLEILVGSDGSTDRTAEIVRRWTGHGVRLLDFAVNRGKAAVLNSAIAEATGDVVLLSDANTEIAPDAPRRLASWFRDPQVGAVVGRLVLTDPLTGRNADGLYWKYETFLKRCEARLGALLGANGAIYAIRRDLYKPIPEGTIVDDFVIPLLARQRTGCALAYDADAVAFEETAADVAAEFHRRARIGAGGFQSIGMLWRLLDPRQGWIALAFLSHKVLRWTCPFFLIGLLASNLCLLGTPAYQGLLVFQVFSYGAAVLGTYLPGGSGLLRPLRLAALFAGMNVALLVGFVRWARGTQRAAWRRTPRLAETERAIQ